jgi:hypothetical protein
VSGLCMLPPDAPVVGRLLSSRLIVDRPGAFV